MAGAPWEKYEAQPTETGPWDKYSEAARVNPLIAAKGAAMEEARETARANLLARRDPGIDYKTGIPSAAFRAGFSRMTNEAEKANYLDRYVGVGKWGRDTSGAYFIRPEGLGQFGVKSMIPVSLDEQAVTRYDLADVAGDLPAIAGGTAYGLAATGLGVPAAMGMGALGAAGGKAIDEIIKNQQGLQIKTPQEVATTLGGEALGGALGEGLGRGVSAVARYGLGPGARRMTPESRELAKETLEQGFAVRPGSVTEAPLLARWEGMIRQIFGDLNEATNRRAAEAGMARLRGGAEGRVGMEEAGEAVQDAIRKARVQFSKDMEEQYLRVERLAGNQPIVPTAELKAKAQAILDVMPSTAQGKTVGGKDQLLRDIVNMNDTMSLKTAVRLRTTLREASESKDIIADVSQHDAGELKKALERTISSMSEEGSNREAIMMLRATDAAYKKGIQQFDRPIIKAITKDASRGTVDPDMVVNYLIKPDRNVRLRQVKQLVSPEVWEKVSQAHVEDLLSNVVQHTDDPLKKIFDGRAFRDALDRYGRDTLAEVHGREWVNAAYKYAHALMLSEKRMGFSGGIVAANVALHPVQNIPLLTWLRGLARLMQTPTAFKYLTDGIQLNPATKQGGAAITRVFTQAAMNARDETGSARVNLPEE